MLERRRVPEVMDDPGLDPRAHNHALRGLARINRLSAPERALGDAIIRHLSGPNARADPGAPLRVLDVAAGSGDVPLRLVRRLCRSGLQASLLGVDISEHAVEACRERAERSYPGVRAEFRALDVLGGALPAADVVTCSLFAHHLDEDDVVRLLASMAHAATWLVLLNDLERSRLGLLAASVAPRLLTRSPVVHTDAVRSVHGAWTPGELLDLAERAGMGGASIRRTFPCRMVLSWARNAPRASNQGDRP